MQITMRHYYSFQSSPGRTLLSPAAWECVRLDPHEPHFYIADTRSEWLDQVRSPSVSAVARQIHQILSQMNATSVFSIGVGRASVEYALKTLDPTVRIFCTENSVTIVKRLKEVFTECDSIDVFDLEASEFPVMAAHTLTLLYRVDTELSDSGWQRVFARMARAGLDNILLVATELLTPQKMLKEFVTRYAGVFTGRPSTFAGYVRSKARFQSLWARYYAVVWEYPVGSLTGFLLKRTP